nr:FAD-binding protein [Pseudonocardia sp.]
MPRTVEAPVEAVAVCHESGVAVLSRGGGTSLAGECCNDRVVIDWSKHRDACSPSTRTREPPWCNRGSSSTCSTACFSPTVSSTGRSPRRTTTAAAGPARKVPGACSPGRSTARGSPTPTPTAGSAPAGAGVGGHASGCQRGARARRPLPPRARAGPRCSATNGSAG